MFLFFDIELRIEVVSCLMNLLKDKKLWKRLECRVILEWMFLEVVFSFDFFIKKFFVNYFFENKNLLDVFLEELYI